MESFYLKVKPLTPLWTGDENRSCDRIRETGIIGSLRWWYEALIRGLGGYACDPTNSKCNEKNHCDACELFGCTGWARKFRLEVVSSNLKPIPEIKIGTREKRFIGEGERYLMRIVKGLTGEITLKFIPIRDITENEWALLNKTLQIIADYGALGARTSQGNGVIKIIENNLPYRNENIKKDELKGNGNKVNSPNLENFFFYKFRIKFKGDISKLINNKIFWTHAPDHRSSQDNWENWEKLWSDYHFLPIAFHVRDAIRHLEDDRDQRHAIFGELGKGSKVFVSHGYKINNKTVEVRIWKTVEVRIWGYDVKEDVKNKIKKELENGDILKEKFFSGENKESLESCTLIEEKTGKEILEKLLGKKSWRNKNDT